MSFSKTVTTAVGLALIASAAPTVASAATAAPTLLLRSVKSLDVAHKTVVLPVHKGVANGTTVWYILTDVSDADQAKARGLVFAPLLAGIGGAAVRVTAHGSTWQFPAKPDFSADRRFVPGAGGFPPSAASPGATAPAAYSPFVTLAGSPAVYNAPIVATGDGAFDVITHRNTADRVLALDPAAGTVTLLLADGFAEGKRVFYISTEASDPGVATVERATFAPRIGTAPESARLRIYAIVNGRGQGLADVALHGKLATGATAANAATLATSRNVLGGLPAATPSGGAYDPLWDAYVGAWSKPAVTANANVRLTAADDVLRAANAGRLTSPDGKPLGRAGVAVNCPVIAVAQ